MLTTTPSRLAHFTHSQTAALAVMLATISAGSVGLIYGDHETALQCLLVGLVAVGAAAASAILTASIICATPHSTTHIPADVTEQLAALDQRVTEQTNRGNRLEPVITCASRDIVAVRAEVHDVLVFSRSVMGTLRGILHKVTADDLDGSGPHRIYSEN